MVLFQQFENQSINCEEFSDRMKQLWEVVNKELNSYSINVKKIRTFQPEKNTGDLTRSISWVYCLCDEFTPEWIFDDPEVERDDTDITEEDIRKAVQSVLPKIAATIN